MKLVAAAALLCAAVAAVAPGAAFPARKPPPQLQLVRSQPLTVSGKRFHPRERIRLVVDGRIVARKTTTPAGTFTAIVTGVAFDRCTDAIVYAVGVTGDKALLAKLPQPACPPS